MYVCLYVSLSVCLYVWRGGYHSGGSRWPVDWTIYMHIHISICLCSLMVQACLHPWHSTSQLPQLSQLPGKPISWATPKCVSRSLSPSSNVWPDASVTLIFASCTGAAAKLDVPLAFSLQNDGCRMAPNSLTTAWQVAVCPPESRARSFHLNVEGPKDWQRPSRSLEVSNLCLRSAQPSFWSLNFAKVVVANPGNLGGAWELNTWPLALYWSWRTRSSLKVLIIRKDLKY